MSADLRYFQTEAVQVLVHCTAGASRAPSIVLAFLVFAKKLPLVDAYNYLTAIRPLVAPNKHFLFQLAMLEVSCAVAAICILKLKGL